MGKKELIKQESNKRYIVGALVIAIIIGVYFISQIDFSKYYLSNLDEDKNKEITYHDNIGESKTIEEINGMEELIKSMFIITVVLLGFVFLILIISNFLRMSPL